MRKHIAPLVCLLACAGAFAANPMLGRVEIEAGSKATRDAGVWVDGQYIGYVKNLRRSDRLVLVPGEHRLLFKLIGYQDVQSTIVVEPGERTTYRVRMQQTADATYPAKESTARLRVSVAPDDAAVFIDGAYVGHVDRFDGRKGMRLAPGTYHFTIALPGYRAFETELALDADQTYEIKTELQKSSLDDQAKALSAAEDD